MVIDETTVPIRMFLLRSSKMFGLIRLGYNLYWSRISIDSYNRAIKFETKVS